MKNRIAVSFFIIFGLLISIAPFHADAAGAIKFDFENSGVAQESEYTRYEGKWDLTRTKTYEYYPDGNLKTVISDHEYLRYEGHYDPQGTLMDPTYTFFAGYVEGILLDSEARPVRRYDGKGKLIHFEALGLDFDGGAPYLVKTDYEYDSRNRVSRVSYEYEYLDKEFTMNADPGKTIFEFRYAADGSYTTAYERQGEFGEISRNSYSYDAKHRLIRFDSAYENLFDDELYSDTNTHLYYYNENGFLAKSLVYVSGFETPTEKNEYHYRKKNNRTILCDVYSQEYDSEKTEYQYTITFTYDSAGRLVSADRPEEMKYSYK